MRLRLALSLAVALAAVVAGAATAGSHATTITLYSGQHPQTVAALVTAFEQQTGIHVRVRSDDEDALAAQIAQEGSRSPGDVFLTENTPPLVDLQQRGLLARVAASTLAKVPAKYSSQRKQWLGISARVSVMVYDTQHLKASQLPGSVLDLAKSKWKGKLGLAPGETDFQPIVTAVAAKIGAKRTVAWLEALKSNATGHVYPDNETLVTEVNSGRVQVGLINHYYWYRMRDELGKSHVHSAEKLFAPRDPGYVIDVSGVGILKGSSHQAADQAFLAFLVGPRGQGVLARSESYEYPLGSGVKTLKPLYPFTKLRPDPITPAQLGNGRLAISLLRQAGLL